MKGCDVLEQRQEENTNRSFANSNKRQRLVIWDEGLCLRRGLCGRNTVVGDSDKDGVREGNGKR